MIKLDIWPVLQILTLIILLLPAKRLVALGERFGNLTAVLVVYFTMLLATVLWFIVGTRSYAPQLFGQFEWRYLSQGLLWGIGLYVVGIIGYVLTQKLFGLQQPEEAQLFNAKGLNAIMVVGIILVGPVLEEYVFRGLILHSFINLNALSVVLAVVLSAILFSVYHLSTFQLLPTFFWGIGFAILALQAESLWPVTIAHLLVNGLGFALFTLLPQT
ncbi:hypothetical protein MNBD_CHLOROFLEXI01-918 [hydrothermal vent metagenome]|uniref:CAAX prenyl protease 2/Lysostaphin resistance protein A-like domain-containing protein n=2 Tax=hydrothermal vent metagenome TaxID=652676 RepID=A0A3B0VWY9_9ZZZZ